ncbi:hypothetical protein [Methylomarinum vadi]|uniref:hypothetical protein n=1 Tax=Methylomarinum vadi TaxID=438855 RepID=UPI0004DF07E8|nr:hypothetical protein [Methylomarinum vadi]
MLGSVILIAGIAFAIESVLNSNVVMLSSAGFSWLPVCAIIILMLGFFDCMDALFAKEVCDFMQRMNAGILDLVFGFLLLFGVSDTLERLSLMIVLYLLVRSMLRAIFAIKLQIPHMSLTLVGCLTSMTLGLMIWIQWPTYESWFYSFSLSIEIIFRGLLMIAFAFFIKQREAGISNR